MTDLRERRDVGVSMNALGLDACELVEKTLYDAITPPAKPPACKHASSLSHFTGTARALGRDI